MHRPASLPAPQVRLSLPERRRQLIDVARRVFAQRGFRGATTRQIASAAGVTEALIFQHFPDKDALYAAILEEQDADQHPDRWFAELETHRLAADDEAVLYSLYSGLIALHDRDPHLLRLMMFSALEDHPLAQHVDRRASRLHSFLEKFIADGQRSGRFRAGSPPVLARATLALPVYYILQRHLFKTPWQPVKASEVIDEGVSFTLAGLRKDGAKVVRS